MHVFQTAIIDDIDDIDVTVHDIHQQYYQEHHLTTLPSVFHEMMRWFEQNWTR